MKRERWLATPQMARRLEMHPKTLLAYVRSGRVPPEYVAHFGRRYRWRADFADRPRLFSVAPRERAD